jgi:GT2 family glycosyltransferase
VSETPPKDVAVVIVGLNASAYLKQCLASLAQAGWAGLTHEVIYVDNGSTDDSLDMVRANFPDVTVIPNPSNLGFCRAANQGAAASTSRHYLFLNDDTVVLEDAIPLVVRFLDATPDAGTVGSRLLNHDLTDQWSGRRFPSPANFIFGRRSFLTRVFPNARPVVRYLYKAELAGPPFVVDWVSAAAVIVSARTFRAVGGFAENHYYWHEAIFCDRIRKLGKRVYLHPRSRIIHFEGHGSGPRPYRVRRAHIVNFHLGAYRCFCEHYALGRLNPLRWLVGTALGTRAAALLAANWLTSRVGRSSA